MTELHCSDRAALSINAVQLTDDAGKVSVPRHLGVWILAVIHGAAAMKFPNRW